MIEKLSEESLNTRLLLNTEKTKIIMNTHEIPITIESTHNAYKICPQLHIHEYI